MGELREDESAECDDRGTEIELDGLLGLCASATKIEIQRQKCNDRISGHPATRARNGT